MFGDLLGNMEEQQKEMREKLAGITVEAQAGDGAVKVVVNANREIVNISIDPAALDDGDVEQLEDFLTVAINRALRQAAEEEAKTTQRLLRDMLPPGMGDMFG
jgi:DNA-binding YbaB/EbfC family protein